MRQLGVSASGPAGRRSLRYPLGLLLLIVATSGCDPSFGWQHSITPQGHRMRDLWIGSCIAAAVVGGFVLLLILYAVVAFRRKGDELPHQVRYNLPIEILYTVVPFIIVAALFFYTAVDEIYVGKTTAEPARHGVIVIDVEAFQWGWTFRYLSDSPKVGVPQGEAIFDTGSSNTTEAVLELPMGTPIQFQEHSNNVVHSFFIPQLSYKLDVIPGRTNKFEITALQRTGLFEGHCAELCGFDHARMNFVMKVVTPAQYQADLAAMVAQGKVEPIPDWVLASTPNGSIT